MNAGLYFQKKTAGDSASSIMISLAFHLSWMRKHHQTLEPYQRSWDNNAIGSNLEIFSNRSRICEVRHIAMTKFHPSSIADRASVNCHVRIITSRLVKPYLVAAVLWSNLQLLYDHFPASRSQTFPIQPPITGGHTRFPLRPRHAISVRRAPMERFWNPDNLRGGWGDDEGSRRCGWLIKDMLRRQGLTTNNAIYNTWKFLQ